MFTSDTDKSSRKRLFKTAAVYFAVSALCVVITNIYAVFGHGIRSDSMDFMFLCPLVGGTVVFGALTVCFPRLSVTLSRFSRLAYNLYNSGIATLTAAAMLEGVIEIAGSDSEWIAYCRKAGIVLLAFGIAAKLFIPIIGRFKVWLLK